MEITADVLKNALFFDENLYWTGKIADINKKNKIKDLYAFENCEDLYNKHYFEFYCFKDENPQKIYIELKITPFLIKGYNVLRKINDEMDILPNIEIENLNLKKLGKIKNSRIFTKQLICAMVEAYGDNYIQSGLEHYAIIENNLKSICSEKEDNDKEVEKLNKIREISGNFEYYSKFCKDFIAEEKSFAKFEPQVEGEELKCEILNVSPRLFWTGNFAVMNSDNKIEEVTTLNNCNNPLFEFEYHYNDEVSNIYVELDVNPYYIKGGKVYSKNKNLQGIVVNREEQKNKKIGLKKRIIDKFEKNKEDEFVYCGTFSNSIENIMCGNLERFMFDKYGEQYCRKTIDYFNTEEETAKDKFSGQELDDFVKLINEKRDVFNRTVMREKVDVQFFVNQGCKSLLRRRQKELQKYLAFERQKFLYVTK